MAGCSAAGYGMEDENKDVVFRETWWTKLLSGWISKSLNLVSGAYTTFYLTFIPSGVLRIWIKGAMVDNGVLSPIFIKLRALASGNDWIWITTTACLVLWVVNILFRILRWFFVERPKVKYCNVLEEKVSNINMRLSDAWNELATLRQGVSNGFHRFLAHIFEYLGCGSQERISLYVIRSVDGSGEVELMQRYSLNGEFGKLGRSKYKINEGVIGRAWKDGTCYFTNLPDPERDFKSYKKQQKDEFGYSEEIVRKFSMKARTYFAFKIANKDDCPGFVVLESLSNKFLDENTFQETLMKNNDFLHFMLSTFKTKVPTFEQAMKEEF